jgi:hypothetical protein
MIFCCHASSFLQGKDARHGRRIHTVEVTAATLYESVTQGLAAIRRNEWVAGVGSNVVNLSVADVRVEHQVKLGDFTKWLNRTGGSPRGE